MPSAAPESGLEKVSRFLRFFRFYGFYILMYKDQTQNYDWEIHEEYLIMLHPSSCHIIYSHVQTTA